MKGPRNKWERLWKSNKNKKSNACLYLPLFSERLKTPSSYVCDIGCGNLSSIEGVSNIFLNDLHIFENPTDAFENYVGVDFSREALKLAKESATRRHIKHKTDFVLADATQLPFLYESFESVTCIETLQLLGEDYKEALNEIHRIANKEIYLSMTKITPRYKIIKPVECGWLVKVPGNPYPVLVSEEQGFRDFLSRYCLVKGTEHHPCAGFSYCYPNRLLFKIEKQKVELTA